MSFINEFFSAVTAGIEGSKKEVRGKRQRSSPGGVSAGAERKEDLTAGQINEVSELIQGGMNGLAQVVGTKLQQQNERIAALEQKTAAISDISTKQTELEDRMRALELRPASSSDPAVTTQLADLKRQLEDMPTQQQAPTAVLAQDLPRNLRTHAVIGNLGWDTQDTDIEARAKEVLAQSNVDPAVYANLAAMRQKGSMAELHFVNAEELSKARTAIRFARKRFDALKNVWLDVKKTQAELQPSRMVHRIADFITDQEKNKANPAIIEKDLARKIVKRNGEDIGNIHFGKWKWSPAGHELYEENIRKHAVEWALSS